MSENIQEIAQKELMAIRNQIVTAFIAEMDCKSSEVEIVENGDEFGNLVGFCEKKQKELMDYRNQIVTAFIAEMDCKPSEVEIVENGDDCGNLAGFCVRKQDK